MLTETDRNVTQVFQERIKTIAPVIDLQVFGSRARGDATDESNLDVFIEVETLTKNMKERIFELVWEVGFEMNRIISTIVVTHDALQHGAVGANPLIREIEREGVHI